MSIFQIFDDYLDLMSEKCFTNSKDKLPQLFIEMIQTLLFPHFYKKYMEHMFTYSLQYVISKLMHVHITNILSFYFLVIGLDCSSQISCYSANISPHNVISVPFVRFSFKQFIQLNGFVTEFCCI